MDSSELVFLSIADASALIADGQLSPVELVEAHLARIENDGRGVLNSFVTLLADEALSSAREAEAAIASGGCLGPLHGIPIGLKDLYYTKGVRTTIGSKILGDFAPDFDAAVTERFREAGAVLMGKLQMHEFALGSTSENPHYGPAHNPWDTGRVTGGSSGGSGSAVGVGPVHGRPGQRHRRLRPHPLRAVRHRGPQAHLRARQPVRRLPPQLELRHRGAHDPHRAGRGAGDERHRRARPARLPLHRQAPRGFLQGAR